MYCSETVKSRRDERREITAEGTEQHMLQYIAAMQSRFCAPGVCVCVCMYNGYTLYILYMYVVELWDTVYIYIYIMYMYMHVYIRRYTQHMIHIIEILYYI